MIIRSNSPTLWCTRGRIYIRCNEIWSFHANLVNLDFTSPMNGKITVKCYITWAVSPTLHVRGTNTNGEGMVSCGLRNEKEYVTEFNEPYNSIALVFNTSPETHATINSI